MPNKHKKIFFSDAHFHSMHIDEALRNYHTDNDREGREGTSILLNLQ